MILQRKLRKLNNCYFSKFTRILERGNRMVVFHMLHPFPIYASKKHWNEFLSNSTADKFLYNKLRGLKILIKSVDVDILELSKARKKFFKQLSSFNSLYLVLTKECNYKCTYCPFSDLSDKTQMDKKILKKGVDLWVKNIKSSVAPINDLLVVFYGGEPLLNKECIYFGILYLYKLIKVKKLPSGLKIILATNGSLLDRDLMVFLKKYHVMVTIGLDGINKELNWQRIKKDSSTSFFDSMRIIRELIKYKVDVSISTTITPTNFSAINKLGLVFKRMGIKRFGFNLLRGEAAGNSARNRDLYYSRAADLMIKNFQNQKDADFEFQMSKKSSSFSNENFAIDCSCCGNHFVIMPNGDISHCPFSNKKLGSLNDKIDDFDINNLNYVKKLKKRYPLFDISKHLYYWTSLYGGGCLWNVKRFEDIDTGYQIFAKKVFDFLIWQNKKI